MAVAAIAAALAAYTFAFQGATLYWGRRIAPDNELLPAGLQDAITPAGQTRRNIFSMLLLGVTFVLGFFVFPWYWALGAFILTFLASATLKAFLPKPDSAFFRARIVSSLRSRFSSFQSMGDTARAEAISEILRRFDAAELPAIGRQEETPEASSRMAQSLDYEAEATLAEASRASVWVPWYFKRGALTLVTAPLFLLLVYCLAVSAFGAAIQGLALFRVSYVVFGFIGVFIAVSFGWIPVILPPVLYYSVIKNLPGLWLRPDASSRTKIFSSLIVLVVLPLAAYLVYHGIAWGISWIADRDPCAAFAAGVTGSTPPVDCP